ncbi:hypothetical protein M917_0839 [Psychrobacter aquaticus CMS 56]|uniref:Uncharacterized protein n=2 Tax=Psychrobacter TaxID=497 RepID=U4T7R2_9GAMM|nr:hypothetical protein M917_0839 [Psychrobacter aquaticus CMS 56]
MILAMAGCSSEPQVKDINDMKDDLISDYQVSDVYIEGDQHLMIAMSLPENNDLEHAANVGFNRMGDMLNHVLVSYPTLDAEAKQIYVSFNANLVDTQNNPSIEPMYDVYFDVSELKKLNVDSSSTFYDYLRYANISVRQPMGHKVIEAWCAGDNNKQDFVNVCL